MKAAPGLPLALLAALVVAQPMAGQELQLEVQGFAGGSFAVSNLSNGFFWGDVQFTSAKMEDGFIVGGSAGVRYGPLQLEGGVTYWPSTQVLLYPMEGVRGTELSVSARSNVLLAGGSLLYNFQLRESLIEPFLAAGAGVKKYTAEGDLADELFVSAIKPMWSVGAGARFPISPTASLRIEARDYMSMFDFEVQGEGDTLQHDVMATVGVSFAVSAGGG